VATHVLRLFYFMYPSFSVSLTPQPFFFPFVSRLFLSPPLLRISPFNVHLPAMRKPPPYLVFSPPCRPSLTSPLFSFKSPPISVFFSHPPTRHGWPGISILGWVNSPPLTLPLFDLKLPPLFRLQTPDNIQFNPIRLDLPFFH